MSPRPSKAERFSPWLRSPVLQSPHPLRRLQVDQKAQTAGGSHTTPSVSPAPPVHPSGLPEAPTLVKMELGCRRERFSREYISEAFKCPEPRASLGRWAGREPGGRAGVARSHRAPWATSAGSAASVSAQGASPAGQPGFAPAPAVI